MCDDTNKSFTGIVDDADDVIYRLVGRSTYLRVDLDVIYNNICILKERCSPHTEVIAVVKANAYGHGSVEISRYLEKLGVGHFAVATPEEGAELRLAGIKSNIIILGSAVPEDIPALMKYHLTPTVSTQDFLRQWSSAFIKHDDRNGDDHALILKIDTGMSRNGCQPQEFQELLEYCKDHDLTVHSVMTHFSQAWDNEEFSKGQLRTFNTLTQALRERGMKVHISNSAAILKGYGTDFDYVRPGICIYGLPPDIRSVEHLQLLGIQPALSWRAHPTLINHLPAGKFVGYDNTYRTTSEEWIATFGLGYADGYNRLLSGNCVVSLDTKAPRCPVVGRISMDAITVRLDQSRPTSTSFYILTDDYHSANSITEVAKTLNTIPYEIGTSLAVRVPRVYISAGKVIATTSLVPIAI